MDDDHLKVMESEGYVKAPGAEVSKSSIRKSARLQSKENLSSCSKCGIKCCCSNSKYTIKSSKAGVHKDKLISESKIQEEKKHQLRHRNETNGAFSANTASMKFSTVVPSFQHHVQAEDGIHLVVDLSLKRSDWLKSIKQAVCVCENRSKPAFESFRKEVECLANRNNLKVSSPGKTSAPDASMNSCVQNKISDKSVSSEDGETLTSVVEKEAVPVSDSKKRGSKADQNSELVMGSFENSEEFQLSDFSSPQKGSLCSRVGKICSENIGNNAIEVNQETDGNHRRSTVKFEERINSAEGMEVSGIEENALVTSATDDGRKRKKRYHKSDHIYGQSHERILRSTRIFGGNTFERDGVVIWRSSRLNSKEAYMTHLEAMTFTGC